MLEVIHAEERLSATTSVLCIWARSHHTLPCCVAFAAAAGEAPATDMCMFSRLPYWDAGLMASYDAMHTFGGLIMDVFACLGGAINLTGDTILEYERNHNGYVEAHINVCHRASTAIASTQPRCVYTQPRCCH